MKKILKAAPSGTKNLKPKVVFFGSGPVSLKSLELLKNSFDIEAIITKPTTLSEMTSSGVAQIHAVSNKAELSKLISESSFDSKVAVLIDFGIIVTQDVIDYFPLGIVNSHFSLLPEWRGADPITFAILSGQKRTGVSLMLVTAGMDEGPLLAHVAYEIKKDETTPSLTEALIKLSDWSLKKILPLWLAGKTKEIPQAEVTTPVSKAPTYSRKLTKADGRIDWTKSATQIEREIRAYAGWPRSYTKLGSVEVVITKAHAVPSGGEEPGTIEVEDELKLLMVYAGDGYLCIDRLIPAGKKEMPVTAFLAGYKDKLKTQAA